MSTAFFVASMILIVLGQPPFFIESYAAQILLLIIVMLPITPGSAGVTEVGIGGLYVLGNTSEPVCEVPVEPNKAGIILLGGLNPVAAAEEAGIEVENTAMSSVIDYRQLRSFWEL